MLTVKNLNKNFGKKTVFENLNYTFEENNVYGLLAPNGTGKTTLIRLLTTIYTDKNDSIFYNGKSIKKDKCYLNKIGYLPQQFGLFKELTAFEMLKLMANLKGISKKDIDKEINYCLELVNLSDRADSKVSALSGGMIRRLGIAQTMLGNPDILIFDEPTAGLDPEERLRFKNVIEKIKENKIIIISTHIVEDVESVCDKIVILKNNGVAASGTCEQIADIANGKVFEIEENRLLQNVNFSIEKEWKQNGVRMLRVLTDNLEGCIAVKPTVEDGYLCIIKEI